MSKKMVQNFTEVKVAGTSFENRQELLEELKDKEGIQVELVHESDNPYDKNAIKVIANHKNKEYHIGYINKALNTRVLESVNTGSYSVKDFTVVGGDDLNLGARFALIYSTN